ncbi:MAG: hypothetical protein CL858_18665 [Cupriavidus sp.]|nr:hypothetical protein [Cupriavidus sp.]
MTAGINVFVFIVISSQMEHGRLPANRTAPTKLSSNCGARIVRYAEIVRTMTFFANRFRYLGHRGEIGASARARSRMLAHADSASILCSNFRERAAARHIFFLQPC